MAINITPSKENILKKIRQALSQSTPLPFPQRDGNTPVFTAPEGLELALEFAAQFTRLQGKFMYCLNLNELVAQLQQLVNHLGWKQLYCRDEKLLKLLTEAGFSTTMHPSLASCDAAITGCDLLVARTGTLVLTAADASGRTSSIYSPVHLCIAYTHQLVYENRDALLKLKEKYAGKLPSMISFASGPSRTADIEKTLVTGVHGPKEVYCFLVES